MGIEILRLCTFVPEGATSLVDARIRDVLAPSARTTPGLIASYAARRGTDADAERILVSVWSSEGALTASAAPNCLLGLEGELPARTVEELPVLLGIPVDMAVEPSILRVFRGRAKPGGLAVYIEAAQEGLQALLAAGTGPIGVFLGEVEPDVFVTVSAWSSWEHIALATGGDIERAIASQSVHELVAGTSDHYEIIPNTMSGIVGSAAPVT